MREGEAKCLRQALVWLQEMGFDQVIVESGCRVVVDNVLSNSMNNTEFGVLIKHCKDLLSSCISFQVKSIRRNLKLIWLITL